MSAALRWLQQFGDLTIDLAHYRVLVADQPVLLSYREYALLVYLATRTGQLVHQRRLLEEVLGQHDPGGLRTVHEYVRRLKSRLERGGEPMIQEVPGVGYRFVRQPNR